VMGGRSSQSVGLTASLTALASPLSLVAIAVILINDHVLKQLWPSPMTGKLSDFAGLYFAPYVVLVAIFAMPFGAFRRRPFAVACVAYLAIATAFAALKLSETTAAPLLALASGLGLPVVITVDPSDLTALCTLPLSYAAWTARMRRPAIRPRRLLRTGAFAVAALSIVATSGPSQPSSNDIAIDVSGTVYAAVEYTTASDGVYRLDQAGGAWRRVSSEPGELIADPREVGSLYVLHSDIWAPTLDRVTADGAIARVGPPDRGPRPRSMTSYGPTVFAIARWDPNHPVSRSKREFASQPGRGRKLDRHRRTGGSAGHRHFVGERPPLRAHEPEPLSKQRRRRALDIHGLGCDVELR
jgi:hypothetical protein